jgi:hypothetical protein
MKRIFLTLLAALTLMMPATLLVGQATAGVINCNNLHASNENLSGTDVCETLKKDNGSNPIIHIIKGAGFKFITGGGGSEGVAEARNSVIYVMVGLAVLILSQSIVEFVLNRL